MVRYAIRTLDRQHDESEAVGGRPVDQLPFNQELASYAFYLRTDEENSSLTTRCAIDTAISKGAVSGV